MNRTPVSSSNVRSVGHEGTTLEVEFNSGAVWRYSGVSEAQFQDCLSGSAGKAVNAIKANHSGHQV